MIFSLPLYMMFIKCCVNDMRSKFIIRKYAFFHIFHVGLTETFLDEIHHLKCDKSILDAILHILSMINIIKPSE